MTGGKDTVTATATRVNSLRGGVRELALEAPADAGVCRFVRIIMSTRRNDISGACFTEMRGTQDFRDGVEERPQFRMVYLTETVDATAVIRKYM